MAAVNDTELLEEHLQTWEDTPELDGTYKYSFLQVPPHITTAKEAIAWTFGLAESEYNPAIES